MFLLSNVFLTVSVCFISTLIIDKPLRITNAFTARCIVHNGGTQNKRTTYYDPSNVTNNKSFISTTRSVVGTTFTNTRSRLFATVTVPPPVPATTSNVVSSTSTTNPSTTTSTTSSSGSNLPSQKELLAKATSSSVGTSATTTSAGSSSPSSSAFNNLVISNIEYDGKVPKVESDEYVTLTNQNNKSPIDISGCYIYVATTGTQGPTFVFPSNTILKPNQSIKVYTNELHKESGGYTFGSGKAIWNNNGGIAVLKDSTNKKIMEYKYTAKKTS